MSAKAVALDAAETAAIEWLLRSKNSKSPSVAQIHAETILSMIGGADDALARAEKAERDRDAWQRHAGTSDKEVTALRTTVLAVVEALGIIPNIVPSLLWSDALPAILKQIESLVDQANADAARAEKAEAALRAIIDAYDAEAEDRNDGEFALWKAEDLVNAIVAARAALAVPGETPA